MINLVWPNEGIWCHKTAIFACHLFSAKWLPDPMLTCYQLHSWEQTLVNVIIFFQENAFQSIVCKTVAIFFRPKCVIMAVFFAGFHWSNSIISNCWQDPIGYKTLTPRQNGCHFADSISKFSFLYENYCIVILISLKFVLKGVINNKPALAQIMAWRQTGDKPF